MNGVGADGMVNDIKDINDWIHTKYPGKEVYLLGHSMGSLLARAYVKRWDDTVDKLVICSSPSNNKMAGLGEVLCSIMPKRARSKFLTNIVSSGLNSKFRSEGIKNAWLTRDRESLESYNNNPDVGFIFTNDGYIAFLGLMKQCYSEDGWVVKNPHLPILYLSGGDDPCMKGEDKFMEAISHMCVVGYDTVNYIIYEDMRHEILNEIGKEQVWSDILEFLNE
jgi:alpha-beta hydrolase superfamily lysophospholipase